MSDDNKDLDISYGFVESDDETVSDDVNKAPYIKNTDRATDYRYSGFALIVMSIIGIGFIVLSIMGIIPQFFGNPYLSYGVLFAILVLFFVMGIMSAKNAGGFELKAKSDHLLEKRILDFIASDVTSGSLDEGAGIEDGDSPEIMYFKRTDKLKSLIGKKFVNIDPDFLDALIDEKIYDMIYEEKDV